MPIYQYKNEETGETIDLLQSMHEKHEYVINGVAWARVWTAPQISADVILDAYSEKQFLDKTSKGGTLGDLWDRASDLSAERASKDGVDVLKEKADKAYSDARGGKVKRGKQKVSKDIIIG